MASNLGGPVSSGLLFPWRPALAGGGPQDLDEIAPTSDRKIKKRLPQNPGALGRDPWPGLRALFAPFAALRAHGGPLDNRADRWPTDLPLTPVPVPLPSTRAWAQSAVAPKGAGDPSVFGVVERPLSNLPGASRCPGVFFRIGPAPCGAPRPRQFHPRRQGRQAKPGLNPLGDQERPGSPGPGGDPRRTRRRDRAGPRPGSGSARPISCPP